MLESVFNSAAKEKVLIYLAARKEGYARDIAKYFNTSLSPVQNQLDKLELGNVLVSKPVGKTRIFTFNPRFPFLKELEALLKKMIQFLPESEQHKLLIFRKRPRRKLKPL